MRTVDNNNLKEKSIQGWQNGEKQFFIFFFAEIVSRGNHDKNKRLHYDNTYWFLPQNMYVCILDDERVRSFKGHRRPIKTAMKKIIFFTVNVL